MKQRNDIVDSSAVGEDVKVKTRPGEHLVAVALELGWFRE